jgi:hypothetical protein
MKKKTTPALLVLFLTLFGGAIGRVLACSEESVIQAAKLERFLRDAKVVDVKKEISAGRSRPWIVTLADGAVRHKALFKYFDYRRPQPQPHSYKYELAAYELTKLLGVEIVPPVIERKIENRAGSLQIFLENCVSEQDRRRKKLEPPDPAAFSKALDGIRVFESLVNDECLNYGDLLVHTVDWRLCRVDFSEAFGPSSELRDECRITVCSRALYQGMTKLDSDALRQAMKPFLNDEETNALLSRKTLLITAIDALIAEKGEGAVLF